MTLADNEEARVSAMSQRQWEGVLEAIGAVYAERERQHAKWGEQNHPDGTGGKEMRDLADGARAACQQEFEEGRGSWSDILMEEVMEAMAEEDPAKLREELIQVAAVAVAWAEAIDRRAGDSGRSGER